MAKGEKPDQRRVDHERLRQLEKEFAALGTERANVLKRSVALWVKDSMR